MILVARSRGAWNAATPQTFRASLPPPKFLNLSSRFGVVFSPGSMRSSGCAILFRPSLSLSCSRYDTEGHYLQYELSFRDQSFHVCCLYVPNCNPAQDLLSRSIRLYQYKGALTVWLG